MKFDNPAKNSSALVAASATDKQTSDAQGAQQMKQKQKQNAKEQKSDDITLSPVIHYGRLQQSGGRRQQ